MIFFDIDDTLLNHEKAQQDAAREFGHRFLETYEDEFPQRWQELAETLIMRYLAGEMTFQEQRRERIRIVNRAWTDLSDIDCDILFQEYLAAYERNWTLFDDVLDCLNALRGQPLGIISNGDGGQQRKKLASLGLIERFSTIVISAEIGVAKPDPAVFYQACEAASVPVQECHYIGDDYRQDILASRAAGVHGIWLNRKDNTGRTRAPVIHSLGELPDLIANYRPE